MKHSIQTLPGYRSVCAICACVIDDRELPSCLSVGGEGNCVNVGGGIGGGGGGGGGCG